MKLTITKGQTQQNEKDWRRIIYSIESEVEPDMLELERKRLEALINMWLNEKTSKVNSNTLTKPARRGYCKSCGVKIDPKYTYCYNCNLKRGD